MKNDSPRNPFRVPKTNTKQYKLKTANSIKLCNPEAVATWAKVFVVEKLLAYLNFEKDTKTEIFVSNTQKYLCITVKLFW